MHMLCYLYSSDPSDTQINSARPTSSSQNHLRSRPSTSIIQQRVPRNVKRLAPIENTKFVSQQRVCYIIINRYILVFVESRFGSCFEIETVCC